MVNTARAPPVLDFSPFYGTDASAKKKLIDDIRTCCLHNGFFQITNHRVPLDLMDKVMKMNEQFMDLPLEQKMRVSKDLNTWNRGYELKGSQILEEGTNPELKEGYYIGDDIPTTHPYFINKRLNSGPNQWPDFMSNASEFKSVCMEYYRTMTEQAKDILKAIALTLDLDESFFDEFAKDAVATMRMLHYPPQEKDSDEKLTRGIGAHTDFGAVTLLMQGEVDGLQVFDKETGEWYDALPVRGAFVVNLGNMMMRWSNDKYISNLHRVINKSGKERYSIPFFFSGNPDYIIECLPNCRAEGEPAKYPPITVEAAVSGSYAESYGRAEKFKKAQQQQAEAARRESPVPAVGSQVAVA